VPIHRRNLVEKQKQYSKVLRLTQITDMVSRVRIAVRMHDRKDNLGYDLVWMKDDKKICYGYSYFPAQFTSDRAVNELKRQGGIISGQG